MEKMEIRVCLDVDDLEKAVAFYIAALGLTVGRRFRADWCELLGASAPIDLLAEPEGSTATAALENRRSYRRHWTPIHLDFIVSDLQEAVRRATEAGAKLEKPIADTPYGRIALLSDPFGHGFDLIEFRGRGYDALMNP